MKVRAIDSFRATEVGMVHAGAEIDVAHVSPERVGEWEARGFIKMEAAPLNKAMPAPANKGKRNARKS